MALLLTLLVFYLDWLSIWNKWCPRVKIRDSGQVQRILFGSSRLVHRHLELRQKKYIWLPWKYQFSVNFCLIWALKASDSIIFFALSPIWLHAKFQAKNPLNCPRFECMTGLSIKASWVNLPGHHYINLSQLKGRLLMTSGITNLVLCLSMWMPWI